MQSIDMFILVDDDVDRDKVVKLMRSVSEGLGNPRDIIMQAHTQNDSFHAGKLKGKDIVVFENYQKKVFSA